jgi:hypothetical protein
VAFTWPPEASRCNLCLFYIMNTNCLIKKALGSVVGDLTNSSKSQMSRSQREIRRHDCFKLLLIRTQGQIGMKYKEFKNSLVVVDHSKFFKFKGIMIISYHFPMIFLLLFFLVKFIYSEKATKFCEIFPNF